MRVVQRFIIALFSATPFLPAAHAAADCRPLNKSRAVEDMKRLPGGIAAAISRDFPGIKQSLDDPKCDLGDEFGPDGAGVCFARGVPYGTEWVVFYAVGGIAVSNHVAVYRSIKNEWVKVNTDDGGRPFCY